MLVPRLPVTTQGAVMSGLTSLSGQLTADWSSKEETWQMTEIRPGIGLLSPQADIPQIATRQMETHRPPPATKPHPARCSTCRGCPWLGTGVLLSLLPASWWPRHNAECQTAICSKYCQLCPHWGYFLVLQKGPSEGSKLRRWPLLGPSPGWKRLLALSHLRIY